MDSETNRRELAKGLGHAILAMPLGKLEEVQEEVLARPGRFRRIHETLEVKEVVVGTGERRRRYIVCRNQQEAERQRHHREEILTALKAKLARLDPDAAEHSKRACELVAAARYGRPLTRGPGAGWRSTPRRCAPPRVWMARRVTACPSAGRAGPPGSPPPP